MAASASARLCTSWSRSTGGCGARANRGLRGCRPLLASTLRFRFSAFLDPKLNFTRPSRAQRPQVLEQVYEKKVILAGGRTERALDLERRTVLPVCEAQSASKGVSNLILRRDG